MVCFKYFYVILIKMNVPEVSGRHVLLPVAKKTTTENIQFTEVHCPVLHSHRQAACRCEEREERTRRDGWLETLRYCGDAA